MVLPKPYVTAILLRQKVEHSSGIAGHRMTSRAAINCELGYRPSAPQPRRVLTVKEE